LCHERRLFATRRTRAEGTNNSRHQTPKPHCKKTRRQLSIVQEGLVARAPRRWQKHSCMDAHYDQVMKARATAGKGSRWYFGYSTILDRESFETWRSQHSYDFFELPAGRLGEALDIRLVYDFPSRWWGGRVAGLADAAGRSVLGHLFEIAEADWPIIAHKEGGVTGASVERLIRVRLGEQTVEATAFTTNPARASSEGPISQQFVEALVRGARAAGLPEAYVAQLATP
jgi:gamma-glutamylcyclotransferase